MEPASHTPNLHWQAGSLPLVPPGKLPYKIKQLSRAAVRLSSSKCVNHSMLSFKMRSFSPFLSDRALERSGVMVNCVKLSRVQGRTRGCCSISIPMCDPPTAALIVWPGN